MWSKKVCTSKTQSIVYQRKVREDKKNRDNIKIQDQLGLRALIVVELKSYIAILAPPKHKNTDTAVDILFYYSRYLILL